MQVLFFHYFILLKETKRLGEITVIYRLHNFIQMDRELARLSTRVELCHEEDTVWRRGLTADGCMPQMADIHIVSNSQDAVGPGRGHRADLDSDRRVALTRIMKANKCVRPKGSKEAQQIRMNREICSLTCNR